MVWDLGVRLFHWLLVAGVAGALVTGLLLPKQWLDAHLAFGSITAALIVFRVVWGFVGSTHARFASFVVGPAAVIRHVRALLSGRAGRHLGHNPLGATMIVALLLLLGLLTATGLVALGGELKQGPLAPVLSFATGQGAKQIHTVLAYGLLGLIALHLAGVAFESARIRENIVRPMLSGHTAAPASHPGSTQRGRPRLAAAMLGVLAAAAVPWIVHSAARPGLGVPSAPLDAIFVRECGSCHSAHHPSLAPVATWRGIMAGLDRHFGDDAGLDQATAGRLLAYLGSNSAEHWDTKAANLIGGRGAAGLRITESAAWQDIHRHVPPATFALKAVGGRVNCEACHRDAASGRFAPQSIAVPKETNTP